MPESIHAIDFSLTVASVTRPRTRIHTPHVDVAGIGGGSPTKLNVPQVSAPEHLETISKRRTLEVFVCRTGNQPDVGEYGDRLKTGPTCFVIVS